MLSDEDVRNARAIAGELYVNFCVSESEIVDMSLVPELVEQVQAEVPGGMARFPIIGHGRYRLAYDHHNDTLWVGVRNDEG